MVKQIETVQQVTELEVETGRLFSATHEEIKQGLTTDIYFVKTKEILQKMGRDDAEVVAEIFGRRSGVFAGLAEVKVLLDGLGLEVWSLEEGDAFQGKEVVMRIHGRYSHFGVYETAILGILASSSGWATAARGQGSGRGQAGFVLWSQARPPCGGPRDGKGGGGGRSRRGFLHTRGQAGRSGAIRNRTPCLVPNYRRYFGRGQGLPQVHATAINSFYPGGYL